MATHSYLEYLKASELVEYYNTEGTTIYYVFMF